MAFDAKAVANHLLGLARSEDKNLTPMKLQKLVYYAQGWCLGLNDVPIINEQVEAWQYGPVIPTLYHEFKEFGNSAITTLASQYTWGPILPGRKLPSFTISNPDVSDENTKEFLKRVWDIYKPYTGIQLSNMTHAPGTPWFQINEKYGGNIPRGTDIPPDMMADYFRKEAARNA